MATYNEKKDSIKAMQNLGHSVLEVEIQGESRFFDVLSFEPPVGGTVSAAPYIAFSGYDITDFLVNNLYSEGNFERFKVALEAKARDEKGTNYQFSDLHIWRFFE